MSVPTLQVAIVGAGRVGRALGHNLLAHDHSVTYVVRSPRDDLPAGAAQRADLKGLDADLLILAVPFGVVADVVAHLSLAPGTVVVDATNPFGAPIPDGFASGAAFVQHQAGPDVRVVKAFNVLGAEHMSHPELADGARPVLPVAADDAAARALVVDLAESMGFDALGVGGLSAAAVLEEAARYWGLLAFAGGRGRDVVLVAHDRTPTGGR